VEGLFRKWEHLAEISAKDGTFTPSCSLFYNIRPKIAGYEFSLLRAYYCYVSDMNQAPEEAAT
jgi:DUF1365 family protein